MFSSIITDSIDATRPEWWGHRVGVVAAILFARPRLKRIAADLDHKSNHCADLKPRNIEAEFIWILSKGLFESIRVIGLNTRIVPGGSRSLRGAGTGSKTHTLFHGGNKCGSVLGLQLLDDISYLLGVGRLWRESEIVLIM